MERVTFIVTATGERLSCLLNPEHVVLRRAAGVRPQSSGGLLSLADLSDEPLLATGGGRTEIDLDLLFDTEVAARNAVSAPETVPTDVRLLTKPFWDLAENHPGQGGRRAELATVRFFWGRNWNVPCVVVAVAERLEQFDGGGAPHRSWLRLRLARVPDPAPPPVDQPAAATPTPASIAAAAEAATTRDVHIAADPGTGPDGETLGGERLDALAAAWFGQPWLWRLIADVNDLTGPFAPPGMTLVVPEVPEELLQ